MEKKLCVVSCPISCYAGYGARARDLVKQLIRVRPDWDVKILPQRWGDTRQSYLEDHKEYDLIGRCIAKVESKPDVWIQITVPNEFQPVGKFNIGITAAIETTLCDSSWIEGCNRMNLVIVSSEHGKFSLENSVYVDNRTGSRLRVEVPIEILFEGVDTNIYKPLSTTSDILEDVKNPWNFLCVGNWLPGSFGQDRKNIAYTIKAFLEIFKDQPNAPGLILKTTKCNSSISDQNDILDKIYTIRESVQYTKSLPDIYLLHGDLSDEEMNELYQNYKVKAFLSLTKGEGFGRPLLEFAFTGKPVICSGWSGPVDFLDPKHSVLIGGKIQQVHPDSVQPHVILKEASWFTPDDREVQIGLTDVVKHYDRWKKASKEYAKQLRSTMTVDCMGTKFAEILDNHVNFKD